VYCAQCGTSNDPGGDTCDVCGAPLTAEAGPERCPSCDAPISVHDRYCRSCGASLIGPDAARYEPGPSFVDDSNLEVDPATLPPWLRDVVGGSVATAQPAAESLNGEQMPEWLQTPRPDFGPSGTPTVQVTETSSEPAGAAGGFSLIGEDDLPEWLRALGDEESDAPAAQVRDASPAPVAAVAEVPRVSRAWLERPRTIDPAAEASARQQFAPLESETVTGHVALQMQPPVAVAPAAVSPAEPAPAGPVDVVRPRSDAERRKRRVRILILLLAIAVLVLLLVLYMGGSLQ